MKTIQIDNETHQMTLSSMRESDKTRQWEDLFNRPKGQNYVEYIVSEDVILQIIAVIEKAQPNSPGLKDRMQTAIDVWKAEAASCFETKF